MNDEIIQELWRIKEEIAKEHGYALESLAAELRRQEAASESRIVDRSAVQKPQDSRRDRD